MKTSVAALLLLVCSGCASPEPEPVCSEESSRILKPVTVIASLKSCEDERLDETDNFAVLRRDLRRNGICRVQNIRQLPVVGRMIFTPCVGDFAYTPVEFEADASDTLALKTLGFSPKRP